MIYELSTTSRRFLKFDTGSAKFSAGMENQNTVNFAWSDFLRFSASSSWNFLPAPQAELSAQCQKNRLTVLAESETYRGKIDFYFEEEILHGDLSIAFKGNAAFNFAAVALPVPDDAVLTMPGNLYNNNPSTAQNRLVPRFPSQGKASLLLESSRLVLPGVNAEFDGSFLSLFTASPQTFKREWTLGFHRDEPGETKMMLTSGALSFNGEKDIYFAGKLRTAPIQNPYPQFRAGDTLCHHFALSWGKVSAKGHGFRDLAQSGFKIFKPVPKPALPLEKVTELKVTALHERWGGHGYWNVLGGNLYRSIPKYLYGWTGQSFRLALCDLRDAYYKGETGGIDRALECVRFFLEGSKTAVPGLRNNLFWAGTSSWDGERDAGNRSIHSSRALGETWSDLARILIFCRDHQLKAPGGALEALKEGLQFFFDHRLPEGVPPMMWFDDGTPASPELTCAGSSILPAFFDLWQLTGETEWKERAEAMLEIFWRIGGNDFRKPFSHATLDAACEDKESGIPVFNAALKAWKLTGISRYKEYAEVIGDWLLTWVCFTDLPLKPGSICAKHDFHTVGWPTVSIENQHLDVFFPAWEMYEFGRDAGISRFREMGKVIFAAWSHGISQGGGDWMFQNPGRQCEQFFHTDWCFNLKEMMTDPVEPFGFYLREQGCTPENICTHLCRGGANPWDVAWIIALVLDAAQNFQQEQKTR